jgi:hypothetical protein
MTALLLAGKGRVVAEKRAMQRSMKIPFPSCLNAVYFINRRTSRYLADWNNTGKS